ncbi:MAG TPA: phage baseplate assembly protein V [Burkholderiaceae bacterium]|nr:phage baseplate assembly protein V [Burkholderiaceae bacterium]
MKRDALPFGEFGVPPYALAHAHLGRVTSVNDPDHAARVQVELYAADTDRDVAIWARVASPFAGKNRGGFFIPQEGDEVLVVFVNGDSRAPVVVGGLWNGKSTPPERISGKVDRWSITGKAGTKISIIEQSDATATIKCETPGGVTLTRTDEGGGKVEIVCGANTVKLDTSGVSVRAAAKVSVQASTVDVTAGSVKVDAAMSNFSGIVKCDVLQTNAVVGVSYTPGAGNVW